MVLSPAIQTTTFLSKQLQLRKAVVHPSNTYRRFTLRDAQQTIVERFEEQVRNFGDCLAVKSSTTSFSYEQLNARSNEVAHCLLEELGQEEKAVALLFEPGTPFVTASLGTLKAGKIQVPLDNTFPMERLEYILQQSGASAVVTSHSNLAFALRLAGRLPVINLDEVAGAYSTENPNLDLSPEAPISIEYTSGSTGQPKGTVQNHRGVMHAVMNLTNAVHLCSNDRLSMFRASLRSHLFALLNGAAFLPVMLGREEPERVVEWFMQEKITIFRGAVSAFRSFAGSLSGRESFPHLRLIMIFGEQAYKTDVELYRKHFSEDCLLAGSLGCSEFGDYAYYFVDRETPLRRGVIPGGYPVEGPEILLLDEEGEPVEAGRIGELGIRSRYGAVGYWRREDLTRAAFLPDPLGEGRRVYRTGDLGQRVPDGCLIHLGRKDFQVKIRGHRVNLSEVEVAMHQFEGIKQAVVVGREDTPGDMRLVAYFVTEGSTAFSLSGLRHHLTGNLPSFMVPSAFIRLDAFPKTATGKLDRRALPAPGSKRPLLDTPYIEPRTPLESELAELWAEVLGVDLVGVRDNFLELGGHSLLATQLISRIFANFRLRLPLGALWKAPTVEQMAQTIIQGQAGQIDSEELSAILSEIEAIGEFECD